MDAFTFEPLSAPRTLAQVVDPLAAARAEAESIRSQAHEEGFTAGYEAGRAQAMEELAPAAAALAQAGEAMQQAVAGELERAEHEAVALALAIAEKVVAGALEADPARVTDIVAGALRRLMERERVVVLVHPDDLSLVREAMDGIVAALGGIEHCEVQAERRMVRGGAVVRTAEGEVDARIESKLERVRDLIAGGSGSA